MTDSCPTPDGVRVVNGVFPSDDEASTSPAMN